MIDDENAVIILASRLETEIQALEKQSYVNDELESISHSILLLCLDNVNVFGMPGFSSAEGLSTDLEILEKRYMERQSQGVFDDYAVVHLLPLQFARIILKDGIGCLRKYSSTRFLNHPTSYMRFYSYKSFWLVRRYIGSENVRKALFFNIADKLGYIDENVGLLAGLFNTDSDFFTEAALFDPPEQFEAQYRHRINQISVQRLLPRCRGIFEKFEAELKRYIVALGEGEGERKAAQSSESGGSDDAGSGNGPVETIEEALSIVARKLELSEDRVCEYQGRATLYGFDLAKYWLVSAPWAEEGWLIRDSRIVLVDRQSGQIAYDGGACDEG